jgi:uridine kinase
MVSMEINEIKRVLLIHHARYPNMQIRDMVKLIYQNEWAGGHMIADEADSLARLREECASLSPSPGQEAFEDIGGGLCRFYLRSSQCGEIGLTTLNRFFVNTANENKGTVRGFEEKLAAFRQCCADGELPYPAEELDAYIESYKAQGYPPVHHSDAYRDAYTPAYRVVKAEYRKFFGVFRRIDALMKQKDSVYVAIDGNCGAGKSTLASLIGGVYDCNVFHMDDYFLPPALRTPERLAEVGGNVDYGRFREEIVAGLLSGGAFTYRVYDCMRQEMGPPVAVTPKRLNIIEGAYSLHPTLADTYDLKIFLGIDVKEQSRRILARNGSAMHRRFMAEWVPMENRYFERMGIRERCDLAYG